MTISKDPATHSLFAVTFQAILGAVLVRAPLEDGERAGDITKRAAFAAEVAHKATLEALANTPDPHPLHVLEVQPHPAAHANETPDEDDDDPKPEVWLNRDELLVWIDAEIETQNGLQNSTCDRETGFVHEGRARALDELRGLVRGRQFTPHTTYTGVPMRTDAGGAGGPGATVAIRLMELAVSASRAMTESPYERTRQSAKGARDAYMKAADLVTAFAVDLTTLRDEIARLAGLECTRLDATDMLGVLIPFVTARAREDARKEARETVRTWLAGLGYSTAEGTNGGSLLARIVSPTV